MKFFPGTVFFEVFFLGYAMSLADVVFGKPLASSEEKEEELTVVTGVPVLGLDALASTGYGPEAALIVLLPLGVTGLRYYPIIVIAIVVKLFILYLSYQQTAAAYPNGGGAYVVAKENLGMHPALWAAVSLMLDYLLNVAVGIAAGVGAVVSVVPSLHPYLLTLCLVVLLTLTVINLRGVRESGLTFVVPVFLFVGCVGTAIVIGLFQTWQTGGNPQPVIPPPPMPAAGAALSTWILLTAFANGCTAMTGVEAVSNGIPLFREPKLHNAQRTLTVIVGILSLFLLSLGFLCPAYHIVAMDERQPGYQTVLTQLIAAVAGHGVFYYVAAASIFTVLTYSAQTSFADFPRVCRLLAEDRFLPPVFAERGRRLVLTHGIIVLATLSCLLLIAFRGVIDALVPLFAVGAFSAFLFSQAGMVVHWLRRPGPGVRINLFYNALGAATTAVVLVIIVLAKFTEGAWMTIIFVPALVLLLERINHHYRKDAQEMLSVQEVQVSSLRPPAVIIPVDSWNRGTEKAVRLALMLSDDITALHISMEEDDQKRLKEIWKEKVERPVRATRSVVPSLRVVDSPYRWLYQPIVEFVKKTREEKPDRLIAVIIPELIERHWYTYLLHPRRGARLRHLLYEEGDDRTIVIDSPWYLR
jgi:amino acid transporter